MESKKSFEKAATVNNSKAYNKSNYKNNKYASKLLLGYNSIERKFYESMVYKIFSSFLLRLAVIKRAFSRSCEKSCFAMICDNVIKFLLEGSLRYYGVFLFFFGIFFSSFSAIREISIYGQFAPITHGESRSILIGIISVLISAILMTSQSSIASLLCESRFFSFFLFDVLCFERNSFENIKPVRRSHTLPVILGILISAVSVLFSLEILIKVVIFATVATIILKKPENGVIFIFLVLLFFDLSKIFFIVGMVCASFILKVLRNKRVYKISLFGVSVIFFSAVVLISGIISVNNTHSLRNALLILLFILFGVVIGNTIKTGRLVAKCISALMFSSSVVAFIGIVCFILEHFDLVSGNIVFSVVYDLLRSIPFASENIYAEIVVLTLPFAFVNSFFESFDFNKVLSFISFLLLAVFSFITFDISVWFAAVVSLILYLCILRPRLFIVVSALTVIGASLYLFLPIIFDSLKGMFYSYTNTQEVATAQITAYSAFSDVLSRFKGSGTGVGASSFEYVLGCMFGFGQYTHSELTLFASILLQYGIIGIVSVGSVYLSFLGHCVSFYYLEKNCHSKYKSYLAACLATTSTVFIKGFIFKEFLSWEALLCICMIFYIAIAIKKSAEFEYVASDITLYNNSDT